MEMPQDAARDNDMEERTANKAEVAVLGAPRPTQVKQASLYCSEAYSIHISPFKFIKERDLKLLSQDSFSRILF
jgi:hypothetical protein